MYRANDVCIVGRGGLYAGTWSSTEFISSLFKGECFIRDLRECEPGTFPWDVSDVYNPDKKAEDQAYSPYGAIIDRKRLGEIVQSRGGDWSKVTTVDAVCMEAVREAIAPIRDLPELASAEVILGVSTSDTESFLYLTDEVARDFVTSLEIAGVPREDIERVQALIDRTLGKWPLRKPRMSYVAASSLLHTLRTQFGWRGPSCMTDAACASSLAAFYLAVKKIRQREADLVITGGVDTSVSPGCLVFFSRLGAMSPEKTVPFDQKAAGLSQGEGAGIFALMRVEDALARGLKIHAVLRACEGSSDGRSSGIVEPTAHGQLLAYQRAYAEAGVSEVDYIEAHGTGTVLGDRTEITSLSQQFPNQRIPIGSVKANVGHTISAAGAAGLLKCIGMIERRAIPPSPHFTGFPEHFKTSLYVAKEGQPLEKRARPLTFGQSSFGFGGSNFHMIVQEFDPAIGVVGEKPHDPSPVVICTSQAHTFEEMEELHKRSSYRLPPNIMPWVERLHLLSIYAVEDAFRRIGVAPAFIDRDRVSVLAASMLPLEGYWDSGRRVISSALKRHILQRFEPSDASSTETAEREFDQTVSQWRRVTEDTLPGFLNNVMAGRVCNAFDFKGVSMNVDSDLASSAAALRMAQTILSRSHGMVIVLSVDEDIRASEFRVARNGLRCTLLASAAYALEHDLPISQILKTVAFDGGVA